MSARKGVGCQYHLLKLFILQCGSQKWISVRCDFLKIAKISDQQEKSVFYSRKN